MILFLDSYFSEFRTNEDLDAVLIKAQEKRGFNRTELKDGQNNTVAVITNDGVQWYRPFEEEKYYFMASMDGEIVYRRIFGMNAYIQIVPLP